MTLIKSSMSSLLIWATGLFIESCPTCLIWLSLGPAFLCLNGRKSEKHLLCCLWLTWTELASIWLYGFNTVRGNLQAEGRCEKIWNFLCTALTLLQTFQREWKFHWPYFSTNSERKVNTNKIALHFYFWYHNYVVSWSLTSLLMSSLRTSLLFVC